MNRTKYIAAAFAFFSLNLVACSEKEAAVEEIKEEVIELQVEEPELVVNEEEVEEVEEVQPEMPKPKLEERAMKQEDEPHVKNLPVNTYTAESTTLWALNSTKDLMSREHPQVLIRQTDRYQVYLEMKKEGTDVMWYMTTYNGDTHSDYILVSASTAQEESTFKWEDTDRVDVQRKVVNSNNKKTFNLNERYEIDNDGKFTKIVR